MKMGLRRCWKRMKCENSYSTSIDVGALRHVFLPLFVPMKWYICATHCALHNVQCDCCSTIVVVKLLQCNMQCQAAVLMNIKTFMHLIAYNDILSHFVTLPALRELCWVYNDHVVLISDLNFFVANSLLVVMNFWKNCNIGRVDWT